jgi:hypothetical protein
MTIKVSKHNQWAEFVAYVLAFIGTLIAVGGSVMFFANQAQMSGSFIWPLPGLVLMDWAILGVLGFLGVYLGIKPSHAYWLKVAWFVAGALIPLVILGVFSIGSLVLISFLFFVASTIFITIRRKMKWLGHLGLLMVGAVCNLGLLLLFIALSSLAIS